jgi:hypothetical protein
VRAVHRPGKAAKTPHTLYFAVYAEYRVRLRSSGCMYMSEPFPRHPGAMCTLTSSERDATHLAAGRYRLMLVHDLQRLLTHYPPSA